MFSSCQFLAGTSLIVASPNVKPRGTRLNATMTGTWPTDPFAMSHSRSNVDIEPHLLLAIGQIESCDVGPVEHAESVGEAASEFVVGQVESVQPGQVT